MPNTLTDNLQTGLLRNQHHLVQFEKSIDAKIQANLLELQRELRLEIEGTDFGSRTLTQQNRLTALQSDVNAMVNDTYRQNTVDLQKGLTSIAKQAERLTVSAINKAFTFDITGITLTPLELRSLARNPVVLGGKVTEQWWTQKTNLKRNFVQQMRLGLAQGETNAELVNRVIGKPTGKRQTITTASGKRVSESIRAGGIMDAPRREATALVRTSAQTVSNDVLLATYRENADIISAVEVLVTLDGRTTHICISLSGGIWDIQTGEPLPSSPKVIGWPGPPPYHWQSMAGSTPITAQFGVCRLDEIKPGDMVMTGKARFRPCYAVHRKLHKGRILDIGFASGAKITITDDHPLAIAGRGWQPAGQLKIGDQCFQYQKNVEPGDDRTTPGDETDRSPTLLAEELIPDEVFCLPLFARGLSVNLEHDTTGESEVDNVAVLAQLKQVVANAQAREDAKEVDLAGSRAAGQVAGSFAHDGANRLRGRSRIVLRHSFGHFGESGVGVFGQAVVPIFGSVMDAGGVRQRSTGALASSLDPVPSAVVGHGPVSQTKVTFQSPQGLAAGDVSTLDELLQQVTIVPGAGFTHDRCISIVERAWVGTVYNLSVVGDETYVASAVLVHNCRTVVAPVTKSWDELGTGKKSEINRKAEDPVRVRASVTGPRATRERQAYKGFLEDQGVKFQNKVLGKRRAEMFRAGDLKLENLTSGALEPLTLTQLKAIQ